MMKIGDKIKWFTSSEGWKRGTLLTLPKDAFYETCLVKTDSGERGYIDFNCIK